MGRKSNWQPCQQIIAARTRESIIGLHQNSPFDQAEFDGKTETVALPAPTACSLQITNAALWLLKKMYRPGVYYQKAGVMLSELIPQEGQQTDLFAYSSSR